VGLAPDDADFGERRGLTTARIARSTGIPRETVRRKLHLLENKGSLERGPHDEWRVAVKDGQPVIRAEFSHEWQREMERIVKFVRALKDHV
jgi:DNA-binding GntR family transcriptional regulator